MPTVHRGGGARNSKCPPLQVVQRPACAPRQLTFGLFFALFIAYAHHAQLARILTCYGLSSRRLATVYSDSDRGCGERIGGTAQPIMNRMWRASLARSLRRGSMGPETCMRDDHSSSWPESERSLLTFSAARAKQRKLRLLLLRWELLVLSAEWQVVSSLCFEVVVSGYFA